MSVATVVNSEKS